MDLGKRRRLLVGSPKISDVSRCQGMGMGMVQAGALAAQMTSTNLKNFFIEKVNLSGMTQSSMKLHKIISYQNSVFVGFVLSIFRVAC